MREQASRKSAEKQGFLGLFEHPRRRSVADLLGAGSNHLAEMLKDWNAILKQSSLGRGQANNSNEREDGSAPRDSRPAVTRRRKIA